MIRPDRLTIGTFHVCRHLAADVAQAIADACRAWVARLDERAADACNGPEDS